MLFLTSDCTFTSEPLVSGTKTTAPDVVSKFDPLITIVAFPDASLSIVAAVTVEPPSRVKLVMVGGLSIDFQSDPSQYCAKLTVSLKINCPFLTPERAFLSVVVMVDTPTPPSPFIKLDVPAPTNTGIS